MKIKNTYFYYLEWLVCFLYEFGYKKMNIESHLEGPSDFTQVYPPSLSQILLQLCSFR